MNLLHTQVDDDHCRFKKENVVFSMIYLGNPSISYLIVRLITSILFFVFENVK